MRLGRLKLDIYYFCFSKYAAKYLKLDIYYFCFSKYAAEYLILDIQTAVPLYGTAVLSLAGVQVRSVSGSIR